MNSSSLLPHIRGRNDAFIALFDYLALAIKYKIPPIPSPRPEIDRSTLEKIFASGVAVAVGTAEARSAEATEWDRLNITARERQVLRSADARLASACEPVKADPSFAPDAWRALMDACGPPRDPKDLFNSDPSAGWYHRDHVLRAIDRVTEAAGKAPVPWTDGAGVGPEGRTLDEG